MTEGYLLCCFNDEKYFKLAHRIVKNIRIYDSYRQICILTDNPDYFEESYVALNKILIKKFDYENIPQYFHCNIDMNNTWNKNGLIPKVYHSYYTPFENTMFMDVDMIFKKDFTFIWEMYYKSPNLILFPGLSDKNNRSPSNWHWGCIDELMQTIGISIPQVFGTVLVYNSNVKNIMTKHLENIFVNIESWNVRCWYRNGLADEIVYAIIFGFENVRPNIELHDWLLNQEMCDPVNKDVDANIHI